MKELHAKAVDASESAAKREDDPGIAGRYFQQPSWWRRRRRKELRKSLPRHVVRELCGVMAEGRS